jgi:predicted metal-binding membrane protein
MALAAGNGVLKRDNAVVVAALVLLTLLAWLVLLAGAGTSMNPFAMSGMLLPAGPPMASESWTYAYWAIAFCMWGVMMVAMMLPSASPMVLLYERVVRHAEARGKNARASRSIAAFVVGYLTVWLLFSALAVVLQWALELYGAMSLMMALREPAIGGLFLVAAGLYQLTPLKQSCLANCRSPASFLAAHWRPGSAGAWRMGLAHGIYCLGCCFALMLLLFVGGVMNLVWIAGLALIVLGEKLLPQGARLRVPLGVLLMVAGLGLVSAGS